MSCREFIWFSCKVVKKSFVLSAMAVCSAALLAGVGMKKEVPIFMYDFAVMWGRFSAISSGIVKSSFWVKAAVRRGALSRLISMPPLGLIRRGSHWRPSTDGFPEAGLQ